MTDRDLDGALAGEAPRATDYEAAADPASKLELRLWLRLLTCTNMIEGQVRARLRDQFAVTLPRFDLMAQLDKAVDGLSMGELSRRLMVSNGNVTGITERLQREGLISRTPSPTDRRTQVIRLTPAGRRAFRDMAERHERWVADLFSGLGRDDLAQLMALLARLKTSVREAADTGETP